jgi:hypothetical protein
MDKYTSSSERRSRKHYDVRKSSESYSNIATVLAGFAFAAVVLVVQSPLPNVTDAALLRDWATIAFLLAFFGCIVASFTFSVVAGEQKLASRSHAMALLGGAGFAVSTVYVFWGLVALMKLFLTSKVVFLARCVFGGVTLAAPLYLILSAIDPIIAFDEPDAERVKIPTSTLVKLFVPAYIPVAIGMLLRVFVLTQLTARVKSCFNPFVLVSLALILVGAVWALWLSDREHDTRISPEFGGLWIFLHSCVSGFLFTLLP